LWRRLLAAFPLAFAIIIPAVYFPILVMLIALVFRGVAFEFRFKDAGRCAFWHRSFQVGSAPGGWSSRLRARCRIGHGARAGYASSGS